MVKIIDSEYTNEFKELQFNIGSFIKRARIELGFESAESFAYAYGYTRSQYSDYESGNTNPTLFTLFKLLKNLGIEPEEFFDFKTVEPQMLSRIIKSAKIEQVREQVKVIKGEDYSLKVTNESYFRIYLALTLCLKPKTKAEILEKLRLKNTTNNFRRAVGLAFELRWLEMTDPRNPNSPNQRYITTHEGKSSI